MPASRHTPWILCYDIADPRRLQRVYRVARRHATPLQYSVFHMVATRLEILNAVREMEEYIDCRYDDVRAYPLLSTDKSITFGRNRLADNVMFFQKTDFGLEIENPPCT